MAAQESKLAACTARIKGKLTCSGRHHDHVVTEVFKENLEQRHIIFNREVDESVIEYAVMQIEKWNAEDDEQEADSKSYNRIDNPITIFLHSPGGYVIDGFALIGAIEQSRTPVVTVATGMACSMAFLILVSGHIRFSYRHARLMYHQVSGGTRGMMQSQREQLDDTEQLQARIDEIILRRTHITPEKLAFINERKQDWYMWPEEALALGIIDGIAAQGIVAIKKSKDHFTNLVAEHTKANQDAIEASVDPTEVEKKKVVKVGRPKKNAEAPKKVD